MKYHGPKDRLDAARARDTSPQELRRLSQSEYVFVREAIAANPSTPADALESMIPSALDSEDAFKIAFSLSRNPSLRPEFVGVIVGLVLASVDHIGPRNPHAGRLIDALVRCANAPAEALVAMTDPDSIPKHIRGRIAAPGVREEILNELLSDPSKKIRDRAKRAMEEEPNSREE